MANHYHTTFEGDVIGDKMDAALKLICEFGPYASQNQLAKAVGPNSSQKYGYRIIKRCSGKGLITLDADHPNATPQGDGAVVLTRKGKRYLVSEGELTPTEAPLTNAHPA